MFSYLYLTNCQRPFDLLKMHNTFWGGVENKPGSTALSSEGLKSTALNHTALIVLAVLFLYKLFLCPTTP